LTAQAAAKAAGMKRKLQTEIFKARQEAAAAKN
jgi:hypothetical protein